MVTETDWKAYLEGDPPTMKDLEDCAAYLSEADFSYWPEERRKGAERVIELLFNMHQTKYTWTLE